MEFINSTVFTELEMYEEFISAAPGWNTDGWENQDYDDFWCVWYGC